MYMQTIPNWTVDFELDDCKVQLRLPGENVISGPKNLPILVDILTYSGATDITIHKENPYEKTTNQILSTTYM